MSASAWFDAGGAIVMVTICGFMCLVREIIGTVETGLRFSITHILYWKERWNWQGGRVMDETLVFLALRMT